MVLELFPTPSWPQPAFSIPFSVEHKRFPHIDEMAPYPLADGSEQEETIRSFWASDSDNLYVAVDVAGQVNPTREKAWRYGDGMLLTISQQSECEPVQCYTSLGIAGTSKKPQIIGVKRSGTWFPKLDCSKVKYKFQQDKEKARFSATIPWSVLEPLRPLLYETVALNLTFVRQVAEGRRVYQVIPDANYDTEATDLRRLLPVKIACGEISRPLAQSYLTRNCWRGEDPLQINLGLFNPKTCPARLDFTIKNGDAIMETHSSSVELASGCHHWTLKWSPQRPLPTGNYTLEVSGEGSGKNYIKLHDIFVLNPQEVTAVKNDLLTLEEDINCLYPGAAHTALAKLEWLEEELNKCPWDKPDLSGYADAKMIRDGLRNGENPIADKAGLSRRGFRSQVDGSIQSYSLYLPKGFNLEQKWPLLMLLHGNDADEQKLAANQELHKLADKLRIVLLFPRARTTRGYYLNQDETDVIHNLNILKKRLPLDWNKIFLGGFSMGGFGAWHTGLRHPEHFAGLAIISGIPSLPFNGEDFGQNYCFCPGDYSENAKKMSILVVHGTTDCAVPVQPVREIIAALREKGVELTYKENAVGGHGDCDWCSDLASWLKIALR